MIKNLLWVALGGCIGSIARYSISIWLKTATHLFPWATLTVNLIGCLLIGLLSGLFMRYDHLYTEPYRLLLITGLCGSFTTFSTFSLENLQLIRDEQYGQFALYAGLSLVVGIILVALGYRLIPSQ